MKRFAQLYQELDESNKTSSKKAALIEYFTTAPPEDAAWATAFLIGDRPRRAVPVALLIEAVCRRANLPVWLFDECREQVGDNAEAMALLLPDDGEKPTSPQLSTLIETRLLPLKTIEKERGKQAVVDLVLATWDELGPRERFVWNKLLGGAFRVGVARALVQQALAAVASRGGADVDSAVIATRLTGGFAKTAAGFLALVAPDETQQKDPARPYPFFLASPIPGAHPSDLGAPADFLIEHKWDGIRAQLVVRERDGARACWLWSRGEEEIGAAFPDVVAAAESVPVGSVVDGELLAWDEASGVRSFNDLQQRLNRKKPTPKQLAETRCRLVLYDLLEEGGVDLRPLPLRERRRRLELFAGAHGFLVSPTVTAPPPTTPTTTTTTTTTTTPPAAPWDELDAIWRVARSRGVEGLMLKRIDSPYRAGRVRGDWWKWKVAPLSVDAVLVYAQKGSGRRAGLYTDYTFAVWTEGSSSTPRQLVTFAKAYSGLTDDEIKAADAFIKKHTTDRHGPVRVVAPELVMEIGFEGIAASTRHKSGIAVRFPRILRWRTDKAAKDADTVATLRDLLAALQARTPAG